MRTGATIIACLLAAFTWAQQVLVIEAEQVLARNWRGPHKLAKDTTAQRRTLDAVRAAMYTAGYLEASVDSCTSGGDTVRCRMHLGPVYRWARLSQGNLPPEVASAAGFRERSYRGRPVTPRQMARLFSSLLHHYENNGHPFAAIRLKDLEQRDDGLRADLHLAPGRLVIFDSVVVRGSAKVDPRYLHAHIGIRPGDRYSEDLVKALPNRIRELPFVTSKQAPYILFSEEQNKVYLFLDAKKASSFNGVLGVQPDPVSGDVRLTGDLDLRLRNSLKRGEAINLNWRSLQDGTQDLKVGLNMPFVLRSPFGTDLTLKLFKRDTTFLEVVSRAALEYLLPKGDKVGVFINNKSNKRLGRLLIATPGAADVKILSYGLALTRERFDYRFNPRKGTGIVLDGSVGTKRSNTATLTDTTAREVRTVQYDLNADLVQHVPIGKRGTVRLAAKGGAMVNDVLYSNELYRIGGLKTLRGMDEASIYCSAYAIGTIEYRFLFEENSNFFLFVDQGWWEDRSQETAPNDTPLGFGTGTSFETKAGIFSLTYALGRQFNNPIDLRSGKIHFGFTSLF